MSTRGSFLYFIRQKEAKELTKFSIDYGLKDFTMEFFIRILVNQLQVLKISFYISVSNKINKSMYHNDSS